MIQMVPLGRLHVSPLNVRVTNPNDDIPSLADDIHENGLKQNLVVVQEAGGLFGPGDLGVVAGGRRYRAMMHNVAVGRISLDWPVPVMFDLYEDGRATSLSENLHKVAMNPADEYVAYATIVAEHSVEPDPVAYAARRFGVSERHVAQRLRLAALAPIVLEALRAGVIRRDSAAAYSAVSDEALQLAVFRSEEARQYGTKHDAKNIRDALRNRTLPATAMQAVYVGLEAYHAAGGRSDRDLFMGMEEGDRLLDPTLLDQMASTKARAEVAEFARRDGFAEGRLALGFTIMPIWPTPSKGYVPSPPGSKLEDLPLEVRGQSIGLYALENDGTGLELGQWWVPVAPAIAPAPAAKTPAVDRVAAVETMVSEISGASALALAKKAHDGRVQLAAAHLVVERAVGAELGTMLEGKAVWPVDEQWVPSLAAVEGDPDTLLVAMQVRVSRHEWEAALPEAEAQMLADNSAEVTA